MGTVLFALIILLLAASASAQSVVLKYSWVQPDSTVGTESPDTGNIVGRMAIPDGWIVQYNIQYYADNDTIDWGHVAAPHAVADTAHAYMDMPINKTVAMRVQSQIEDGRTSAWSEWSNPFFVDPGPPEAAEKPRLTRIIIGR